jgi:hypothetical protein
LTLSDYNELMDLNPKVISLTHDLKKLGSDLDKLARRGVKRRRNFKVVK